MQLFGTVAGVLGILICLASVVARFVGDFTLLEIRAINWYIVGTGLMVLGCFSKLSGR